VLHGEDTEVSDIDLLVDVPDNATLLDMVRLQSDIESVVGVHVDVLTNDDLPLRFRDKVLREARQL
jgi:predicted nucleotidyltransferase